MMDRLRTSKVPYVVVAVSLTAIVALYTVMFYKSSYVGSYYSGLIVGVCAGALFSFGIGILNKGRRRTGIFLSVVAVFLPVFVSPFLATNKLKIGLYVMSLATNRMMTILCPFFSLFLLRFVYSLAKKYRMGNAWTALIYYLAAYAVIAALQTAMTWRYRTIFDCETTWNAVETVTWTLAVNGVFLLFSSQYAAGSVGTQSPGNSRRFRAVCAAVINLAAWIVLVWRSRHLREILQDFVGNFFQKGLAGAFRDTTWTGYRIAVFKGVLNGEYELNIYTPVSGFEEFSVSPVCTTEPLVAARRLYGWTAVFLLVLLFAVFLAALFFMKYKEERAERCGRVIKWTLLMLCLISMSSQMFLPVYGIPTPLIGNGSCAFFILVVYFFLPYFAPGMDGMDELFPGR